MVKVKIYVEGGSGQKSNVNEECRKAFRLFFEKAGLKGRMPAVVVGLSCANAHEKFKMALASGKDRPILLVDAEEPVREKTKWAHLERRQHNKLNRPEKASEPDVYLMTQCMESWFLSDEEALSRFYGKGFQAPSPSGRKPEEISKTEVYKVLEKMAKASGTKGSYQKGRDAFELLGSLDAGKVAEACPHAKELVDFLKSNCQ